MQCSTHPHMPIKRPWWEEHEAWQRGRARIRLAAQLREVRDTEIHSIIAKAVREVLELMKQYEQV